MRHTRLEFESLENRHLLAVFTVTNLAADGPGSFRDAMLRADDQPGSHRVEFDSALASGTIQLDSTIFLSDADVEVLGPSGGVRLEVDTTDQRHFEFDNSTISIAELSIDGSGVGGGISAIGGTLHLLDSVLSNNVSTQDGGAIVANATDLHLENTLLTGNAAVRGGGMYVEAGTIEIDGSTISYNSATFDGGGIDARRTPTTRIRDSLFHENHAQDGSAVNVGFWQDAYTEIRDTSFINNTTTRRNVAEINTDVYISNCHFTGNVAGHGSVISTTPGGTVKNVVIDGNYGVAIDSIRDLSVEDSKITNNDSHTTQTGNAVVVGAGSGGSYIIRSEIAHNTGTSVRLGSDLAVIESSSIHSNDANGIFARDYVIIKDSTVSNNTGIGISLAADQGNPSLYLRHSTVTGNRIGIEAREVEYYCYYSQCYSSRWELYPQSSVVSGNIDYDILEWGDHRISSAGYNIVGTGHTEKFMRPGDVRGITDPGLGPIADNGGPTSTHMPLPGSPLINQGPTAYYAYEIPDYDQRGEPYLRVIDGRVDIGAVEYGRVQVLEDTLQRLGNESSHSVVLGDLDGDGDPDALITNATGGAKVYENDGDGNFSDTGQLIGSGNQTFAELADLDGDSDLDVAISTNNGTEIWINAGGGVLLTSGQLLGAKTNELALADVDADGDVDLVTASTDAGEPNRLWLNNGNAMFFDSGQTLGVGNARGVSFHDLNGDNHVDLFVVNANQPDELWMNDGAGAFSNSGQSLGSEDGRFAAIGDLDGDNIPDVIVANTSGQGNQVWINDGNGNLTAGEIVGDSDTSNIALGDVDFDGDLDVVAANWTDQQNILWSNDGTGHFLPAQELGENTGSQAAVADLDRDGDLDIFMALFSNTPNEVWRNVTNPLDFNDDDQVDGTDIDLLFAAINSGILDERFDINHDGTLSATDLADFLTLIDSRLGDINLDRVVDGQDFILWNDNKFQTGTGWASGDLNGDTVTDGSDFLIWNEFKQIGASSVAREHDHSTPSFSRVDSEVIQIRSIRSVDDLMEEWWAIESRDYV